MTRNARAAEARPGWITAVCGMASWLDASVVSALSTVQVIFQQQQLGIGPKEIGLLSALLTLGVAVGALVGGRLADRFGRRRVFLVTVGVVLLSALLLLTLPPLPLLAALFLLIGLGAGADLPVALSTIAEAAPDERSRGRMLAVSQLLFVVGAIVPGFLAIAFGDDGITGARVMLGYLVGIAALVFLGRLTIPESPVWLRAQQTRSSTATAQGTGFRELLSRAYIVPFIGLMVWYGFTAQTGGVITQFGSYIAVNAGGLSISQGASYGLIALPFALIAAIGSIPLLGTRARFPMFIIGSFLVMASTVLMTITGFTLVSWIVSLALVSVGGGIAGEALMKMWSQRAFPSLLRSTAQGSVIAVGRFATAGFATITPTLIAADIRVLFGALTVTAVVGSAVGFAVFRTRDKYDAVEAERVDIVTLPVALAPQPSDAEALRD